MTNLLANILILIVTNTVEVLPQHMVQDPSARGPNGEVYAVYVGHLENDEHPTTKTIVTTCKEVTTLEFDWNGPRKIVSERILWQSNVVMKLEWK